MNKEALIQIINFWRKVAKEGSLVRRALVDQINLKSKTIVDITGPRQSGKSSTLKLLIQKLGNEDNWLFINFEDPFFIEHNQVQTLEELIDTYQEYYSPTLRYLFFDEIQNIENWERGIRKLQEAGHFNIVITGSSSKLLSRELSSLITGRHISHEILPLDFKEYLLFHNLEINTPKEAIVQKTKISRYFDKYLKLGGFPKIVLEENEALLKQYYSDIVEKDIIKRHDIRQKQILEKMGIYLLSNASKLLSLTSLVKTFDISFEIASTYLDYFKEAYLVFELPQFSYSLKTQQKALKKIYAVDTGLANAVSFRFSEDKWRIFENSIFLQFHRAPAELYYYKTKGNREVDFLLKWKDQKKELVQVCYDFEDEKTKEREIKALTEAMEELHLYSGTILTKSSKETLKINHQEIDIRPVHEWALFPLDPT